MKQRQLIRVAWFAPLLAVTIGDCDKKADAEKAQASVMAAPASAVPVAATAASDPAATRDAEDRDRIARGKYLVTVGGCHDCHTPKTGMGPRGPELDKSRLLSGHRADEKVARAPKSEGSWMVSATSSLTAWSGPWGTSYAANLTPDADTGLGKWTVDQFKQALRTGKHLGGPGSREIFPPMPWFNYAEMTDADLEAVFAYLRSIPPVSNAVPSPVPNVKGP